MTDIHAPNLLASNTEGKTLYYRQQFQIFHQQFQVHYQPVVSLLNQQIHSFEALLRWRQGYSLLDPAEFIPLAEETGLIIPLGYWVLEETRLQMQSWLQQFPANTPAISVNISSAQLIQPNLPRYIEAVFRDHNWNAQNLQLEIPEPVLRYNARSKLTILSELKALGVRILIDDFDPTSAFSAALRQLPVDAVKLCQVFTHHLELDEKPAEAVEAVIAMAHDLGIEVIAKGIERTKQLEIIKALGCQYGQGFLFSRAVAAPKATELLAAQPDD